MPKTSEQILQDFRRFLIDSKICDEISGRVYYEGDRPRQSNREDAVLILTSANAAEEQKGTVTIHIYFKGHSPYSDGVIRKDGQRSDRLQAVSASWAESLKTSITDGYRISLKQAISTIPIPETEEYAVVIKLSFIYLIK